MVAVFLSKQRKRRVCRPAIHALCVLAAGAQLLLATASVANAQQAGLADRAITFLQDSLKAWGYFKPRDANLPDVKFYCVCGPYRTCEHEAQQVAERLGYRLPQYDYVNGAGRLRQKILFFFVHGEMVEVEIPYQRPFYFTDESEAFCDVNLDKHIPRSREERDAD